jgi:hypothetical protein
MELGLNDFNAGKSITLTIERVGPRKSRLFWAQIALASLVAISGPKKVLIFIVPHLPMALVIDLIRTKPYKRQVHK